jgi:hypothetical protein
MTNQARTIERSTVIDGPGIRRASVIKGSSAPPNGSGFQVFWDYTITSDAKGWHLIAAHDLADADFLDDASAML